MILFPVSFRFILLFGKSGLELVGAFFEGFARGDDLENSDALKPPATPTRKFREPYFGKVVVGHGEVLLELLDLGVGGDLLELELLAGGLLFLEVVLDVVDVLLRNGGRISFRFVQFGK